MDFGGGPRGERKKLGYTDLLRSENLFIEVLVCVRPNTVCT